MKPKFKIGFELEGLVEWNKLPDFDRDLRELHPNMNRGTDGSVSGYMPQGPAGSGIEIRTPPLALTEGRALFNSILSLLNSRTWRTDFATNSTAGLHVNLSEASVVTSHKKFMKWYAHLITKFPERKILRMFDREDNCYCEPIFARGSSRLFKAIHAKLLDRDTCERFIQDKYVSVNFHSWDVEDDENGPCDIAARRVEFRCLGGEDYQKKRAKLDTALDVILEHGERAFHKLHPLRTIATPYRYARAA